MPFYPAHGGGDEGDADADAGGVHVDQGAQTAKIIAICIIPLVCFLAPLLAGAWLLARPRLVSILNVVAAGFIMGFALLHILPDAADDFAASDVSSDVKKYPVVYALVVSAFMLILVMEKALLTYVEHTYGSGHHQPAVKAVQGDEPIEMHATPATGYEPVSVTVSKDSTATATCQSGCCGATGCSCGANCACQSPSQSPQTDELGKPLASGNCGCSSRGMCIINGIARNAILEMQASQLALNAKPAVAAAEHTHSSAFHSHSVPLNTRHPVTAYVLVFGMSLHSIFEGLAIGLGTESYATLLIFLGVLLHKFSEAFAMGVNLQRAHISKIRFFLLVLVFASVVPIGVGIGMGVLEGVNEAQHAVASGVLNGIAAGVLLYVSIMGLIVEEFSNGKDLVLKGCGFLLAAWSMGFISFFE